MRRSSRARSRGWRLCSTMVARAVTGAAASWRPGPIEAARARSSRARSRGWRLCSTMAARWSPAAAGEPAASPGPIEAAGLDPAAPCSTAARASWRPGSMTAAAVDRPGSIPRLRASWRPGPTAPAPIEAPRARRRPRSIARARSRGCGRAGGGARPGLGVVTGAMRGRALGRVACLADALEPIPKLCRVLRWSSGLTGLGSHPRPRCCGWLAPGP